MLTTYLETGRRRTFVAAVDWPGWCRAGRDEAAAVETLLAYESRYRVVSDTAGLELPVAGEVEVVERVVGDATTDFGAPGKIPGLDHAPLEDQPLADQVALLQASWRLLDEVAVSAPEHLRKGPRGGGRDRDAVVAHVVEAEASYARSLGLRKVRRPAPTDASALAQLRERVVGALRGEVDTEAKWPVRYAVRRLAWHVLDHVWEIEDKSV